MEHPKLRAAQCTIVQTLGSTPRKVGAKMLVFENRKTIGTIGGGSFEKMVIEQAIEQIQKSEPKLVEHQLLQQHQMCCGGSVWVFIDPENPDNELIIFGAGHVGSALARLAVQLNFRITLIDNRPEYLANVLVENIHKINADFTSVLPDLRFHENSYLTIMTYDHEIDREILAYCIRQPHAYLGFIGSSRKIEITKKMLLAKQVATAEQLNSVDMPMGLDIAAEGPTEIAISILGKIIAVKNHAIKN